jgi:hypothetical protein
MYFDDGDGVTGYYLIKFTQWTPGGNGGGFSYDRYELFPTTNFVRPNYSADTVDVVTSGRTVLKRDNNGGGLYNSILETFYDQNAYQSPLGTRWNSQYTDTVRYGFDNLNNVRTRTYGTFKESLNNLVGNNILSTDLIMHDLASDNYYKMIFTDWQSSGNGGGVTYDRILIPENQVITFSDGTVKRTAGEPTYYNTNANPFLIPEPGFYHIIENGGGGSLTFPNPTNLNGQEITLLYISDNTMDFQPLNQPIALDNTTISSISNRGSYTFLSINNSWILTNSFFV